jgi:hypothetical protein
MDREVFFVGMKAGRADGQVSAPGNGSVASRVLVYDATQIASSANAPPPPLVCDMKYRAAFADFGVSVDQVRESLCLGRPGEPPCHMRDKQRGWRSGCRSTR